MGGDLLGVLVAAKHKVIVYNKERRDAGLHFNPIALVMPLFLRFAQAGLFLLLQFILMLCGTQIVFIWRSIRDADSGEAAKRPSNCKMEIAFAPQIETAEAFGDAYESGLDAYDKAVATRILFDEIIVTAAAIVCVGLGVAYLLLAGFVFCQPWLMKPTQAMINREWTKTVVIFGQKNHNSYGVALMFALLNDNGDRKK